MKIDRFPAFAPKDRFENNTATQLFGRRFYKDQTPEEYLAEFLLVYASPKRVNDSEERYKDGFPHSFDETQSLRYFPKTLLPLKFFTFFSVSKLETQHPDHQALHKEFIKAQKTLINAENEVDKDRFIRALQTFFFGFVGVAKTRTWATHSFFPVSRSLLSREVMWRHSSAKYKGIQGRIGQEYFQLDAHAFMARGGECLYLQLLNVANSGGSRLASCLPNSELYGHIPDSTLDVFQKLSKNLSGILDTYDQPIKQFQEFIYQKWRTMDVKEGGEDHGIDCGWIPKETKAEAALFAWELRNLTGSTVDALEQLQLMQLLCSLHVLRTICFQSGRHNPTNRPTSSFPGNFVWVPAIDPSVDEDRYKLATRAYDYLEQMILYPLRNPDVFMPGEDLSRFSDTMKYAENNGHLLVRKLGKELGFIVPETGAPMRMTLTPELIRCLTLSLIPPGTRLRLDVFLKRLYLHWGICIAPEHLTEAFRWVHPGVPLKSTWSEPGWFSDALRKAGFLVPLSDGVSLVRNPFDEASGS